MITSRKVYEILHSTSTEKQSEAITVGLEVENKQLKEVIAQLYTNFTEEKKQLLTKVWIFLNMVTRFFTWNRSTKIRRMKNVQN